MNNSDTNQAEQLNEAAVMQSVLKENDLRIGNFIKVISSTKTFDSFITQAKGYDIVRIEEKAFSHWNYEPVTLDEEWLLKFGFKIDETYVSENNPYLDYIKYEVRISMPYYSFEYGDGAFMELKYVHELQNLYFALTQRELTVA